MRIDKQKQIAAKAKKIEAIEESHFWRNTLLAVLLASLIIYFAIKYKEKLDKEEAERQAAEDFARQVFEENKRLQQQVSHGSRAYIETAKGAAEAELAAAREKYKKAYEVADPDAIVSAQEEIARATLKMDRASTMRPVEIDEEKFNAPPPQFQQQERPQLSRRTQRWVENNSDWWGVDDEMTATALGLDKKLAKMYGPSYVGTKDYFKTIDKTMRKRFPENFGNETQSNEDNDEPQQRVEPVRDNTPRRATKPATVVAPASRSTPPNRVKLKASEAAIARRLGVSYEEYARQVAKLDRG